MSRNILAIVGILFCSASAIGQDFAPPKNTTTSGFQPPTSTFTPVSNQAVQQPVKQTTPEIQPPEPQFNKIQATIQPVPTPKQEEEPTIVLPPKDPMPSVQLPAPQPPIKTVELKEDQQTYRSSYNNSSGVSDYRLEVAREKARARRMRMEVKKWYGIDTARPVVAPRVDLNIYSGYYNGVYSRNNYYGYRGGYGYAPNFYYHVPIGR